MGAYLVRRLGTMVPVLVVVSVVVFSIIHLTPGDPVSIMLREDADPAAAAALRKVLGLDRPLPIQYLTWVGRAARGELGRSIRTNQPVAEAILERLPVTLSLAGAAWVAPAAAQDKGTVGISMPTKSSARWIARRPVCAW